MPIEIVNDRRKELNERKKDVDDSIAYSSHIYTQETCDSCRKSN
jgi:hypothetical protein